MKDYLSPSIMCSDLLNMEAEIRTIERGGADWIHYDIMDLSFTTCTMLPPFLLPAIKARTSLKLDVHVMSMEPERYLPVLLPCCAGMNVSVQAESGPRIYYTLTELKKAGANVGIALNKGTPLGRVEECLDILDMILIMNGVAGVSGPKIDIDAGMEKKIRHARNLLIEAGKPDGIVEVDGNISFLNAEKAKANGANAFVLGTASIYGKELGVAESLMKLREFLGQKESGS